MRLLLALAAAVAAEPLYDFSSSALVELTDDNFETLVVGDATSLWVVEFYADWCGHCKQFAPGFAKAAGNLKGIVKFGAVNAEKASKTASLYGVNGYPTVKVLMPEVTRNPYTGKLGKVAKDYGGPRTARGVVDYATSLLPSELVAAVTDGGLESFLSEGALPKALLLGSKPAVSPLLKSLALALKGRLQLGYAHGEAAPETATALGVDGFPRLAVVPAGKGAAESISYTGEMKAEQLLAWLTSHAGPPLPPKDGGGGGGGGAASLVRDLSESDLSSLGAEPHVLAFGDVDGLEALAEATYGQVVVGRAPAALAAKYGGKEAPAVAMLPFGAAEKAAKKAVPFAADAAGLDAAKKGALASLPDSLVDKLGQGSPDMFFSAALTQTAAKAACLLFSDKAEVPPIFRSLSMAFEGQMQFGFAPPAMMAQFNIDRAPALLVLWNENEGKDELDAQAGMKLTGARFMPQVHGKFSYGNIAAFVASVVEQRLQMLGAHAGGAKPAGGEGEGGRGKAAGASKDVGPPPELSAANFEAECTQRGGLCAVALLDGGPDNGNKEAQLAVLAKLRRRGAGGPLSYSWLDATCHTDFVAAFGLGETDLPTMLVLSPGKARWARSVGAFDAETLGAFGNGVAAGRRATESIDAVPALQEVDCASVARGADAVAEDDALGDEIMAEILEEERREREAREAEAAAAAAAAAAGGGQDEGGVAKDEMSELQRMEAEVEQCGVEDLLCKARNEKQLKAIEKRRQLEEKLAKIAKKKKKAKAKAKKAAKKGA